jgi:hypothetical protein
MSRLQAPSAVAAVLLSVCAAAGTGMASDEPVGATDPDSPAHCTNYSTGADTHTACAPSASTPPGAALACHTYTVGSDTHAECAPVAEPRLSLPGAKKAGPTPPASALRCYTYRIGASTYTDCR